MKDSVKKTMKSALALLLAFCLTACGSASVAGNSQPKVTAEEETIADAGPAKAGKSFKSKANPAANPTVKVEDDKTTRRRKLHLFRKPPSRRLIPPPRIA